VNQETVTSTVLLSVDDLHVTYSGGLHKPAVRALRGITFRVGRQETVAVVGESGSGKSTLCSTVLGVRNITTGSIRFNGHDIAYSGKRDRGLGKELQAIFQDPVSSLNPHRTIGQSLAEPLVAQRQLRAADVRCEIESMLVRVGLPLDAANRYPVEFSGGQLQRISIARSLMLHPLLIVCDEPVSSLDVAIQAQVLNLLRELQDRYGCSYLFVSHDLMVVRQFADYVLVLFRGLVVEQGPVEEICHHPQHPYTQALLSAVPVLDPDLQRLRRKSRTLRVRSDDRSAPDVSDNQCPFVDRCPYAAERCREERPPLRPSRSGAFVACHFFESLPLAPGAFGSPAPRRHYPEAADANHRPQRSAFPKD
jgi:oligopeptide/dipeptide ABC transporter ATP-binding protein